MSDTTIDTMGGARRAAGSREDASAPVLVLVWSAFAPARVGEALVPTEAPAVFGRGDAPLDGSTPRLRLVRQRPGANEATAPFDDPCLSRAQLRVAREGGQLRVTNEGKRALLVRGEAVTSALVAPGDRVELGEQLLFLCVERPAVFPRLESAAVAPFGHADATGIVGESAVAWQLRDKVAFVARRGAHVLILGASGTGKELVARAIHTLSSRKDRRLVSRNAATLPAGLIDAELFGHVAGYPNAGMPERPGLFGEAHGSTLFLDEIGELTTELQAHLLRVLDRGGEYQRLGDARARSSDVRLVAATNRSEAQLKHDLAARLRLRIAMPDLNERREDVPLVARHILAQIAESDAEIGRRFFAGWGTPHAAPRLSLRLVDALVAQRYETHVRELEALLWRALASSPGDTADLTPEVEEALRLPESVRAVAPDEVDAVAIRASLARHGGVREKVWRDLGLASRHVLTRLMRKYGMDDPVHAAP